MLGTNPYLIFKDNAEDAFNFYKSAFGGEFSSVMRFKDAPDGKDLSENEKNKIMHISLPIGKDNILMASDAPESARKGMIFGNNFYISISTKSNEETDRLFNSLSQGGKIETAPENTFWGAYFAMFTDKFGVKWMISNENKGNSESINE